MSYKVKIQPSGKVIEVNENESILSAGLRHDLGFPYVCRDGQCGTCKALLLEGKIRYPENHPIALGEDEKAGGVTLLCQARAESDITIQIDLLDAMPARKRFPCRVIRKVLLSHDVVALWMKMPPTEKLNFRAGQYIDILLPDGRHRSFSIANAPSDDDVIELHIRHVEDGDFTGYCYYDLEEKAILRVEGPLGSFFLREDSQRPIIFMAGGTGFAPIKSIIEYALAKDIRREMYLYWGARSEQDLYLHDLARSWAINHDRIRYVPVLSDPAAEDNWFGRTGYVHQAIVDDFDDLSGFEVYAGGPPAMVYAGKDVFHDKGLPENRYYSDAFEFQDH